MTVLVEKLTLRLIQSKTILIKIIPLKGLQIGGKSYRNLFSSITIRHEVI